MNELLIRSSAAVAVSQGTPTDKALAVPFVARIAGLPASVALAFRSDRCKDALDLIRSIAQDLADLRVQAVAKLFSAVPEVSPSIRRSVLAVRRDCFNGREIRYRDPALIASLAPWVGEVLSAIVSCEELLAERIGEFEASYKEARERIRLLLLQLVELPEFRRGLTLASPDLIENQQLLAMRNYPHYGRRERSLEHSLARYAIRAAVKLSPYSTLTKLGLGVAVRQDSRRVSLLAKPWQQRSLVRLKSYLPEQWVAILLRLPQIRKELLVEINDTLEDLGGGRHQLLRPWMLQWSEAKQDLVFIKSSLVRVRLVGPLVDWLKKRLAGSRILYSEINGKAASDLGATQEDIGSLLEKFIDIGVLKLLPPWPTYEPYPEQRILNFLESSPVAALVELESVRSLLGRLVEVQNGYVAADSPAASIREINSLAHEVFDAIKKAVSPSSDLKIEQGRQDIYEDVLMHVQPGSGHSIGGEIVHVGRALADEILEAGNLLWRIRGLYERRHECLHAFWHSARELWPIGSRVPCLRFFASLEGTWQLYVNHLVHAPDVIFNPDNIEVLRSLGSLRESVVRDLVLSLDARGDGYDLPLSSLRGVLSRIPTLYQAPLGPCLMVQPADPDGHLWVTHRLADGSGRFSSRFSALMPEPLCNWFTGHFTTRSAIAVSGESADLLDLLYTHLTTVNRHWPQTRKVLETPGETADLPAHRVVRPADLFIEIGDSHGDLRLRGKDGRRYLPCFLSALHAAWVPTFVKFLSIFGIDTRGRLNIPAPVKLNGTIEVQPRLTVGSLVFRRRRWIVPVGGIPRYATSDSTAFAEIWNWRCRAGLPERLFWIERLRPKVEGIAMFKPQFVDFTSPTLVSLFLAGLEKRSEEDLVTFEEALPVPEDFPKDEDGEGWGTELTLESIAFQDPV